MSQTSHQGAVTQSIIDCRSASQPNSPVPRQTSKYKTYTIERGVKILSALQIVIGIVCVLSQIVTLYLAVRQRKLNSETGYYNRYGMYYHFNKYKFPRLSELDRVVGAGFWIGISYIAAGAVGVASARKKSNGLIIAMMVINIIVVSTLVPTMIGLMGGSIDFLSSWDCDGYDYKVNTYRRRIWDYTSSNDVLRWYTFECNRLPRNVSLSLDIIMLVLSVVILGFGIALSVVGCVHVCPKSNRSQMMVPAGQMIFYQNGAQQCYIVPQPGVVPTQPGVMFSQSGVVLAQQPYVNQPSASNSQPALVYGLPGQAAPPPTYEEKPVNGSAEG